MTKLHRHVRVAWRNVDAAEDPVSDLLAALVQLLVVGDRRSEGEMR